jgi:hypothetical protein
MRRSFAIVSMCLGFVAAPVHAQSVHKCVTKGKAVSFQSQPCGAGETTVFVREFTPEPADALPAPQPVSIRTARSRASRPVRHAARATPDTCAEAKTRRDE